MGMAAAFTNESDAFIHYERSILFSKENCFVHEEALACERAAMYCLQLGVTTKASYFIQRSFDCYYRWGASAKLEHIKSKYDNILKRKYAPTRSLLENISIEIDSQSSISEVTNVPRYISKSTKVSLCKRK